MQALEARLGALTGARNEELDDAAKQYRQSIFKLNHKIKKIQVRIKGSDSWALGLKGLLAPQHPNLLRQIARSGANGTSMLIAGLKPQTPKPLALRHACHTSVRRLFGSLNPCRAMEASKTLCHYLEGQQFLSQLCVEILQSLVMYKVATPA